MWVHSWFLLSFSGWFTFTMPQPPLIIGENMSKLFKVEEIVDGRGQIYIILADNKDEANKKYKEYRKTKYQFKLAKEVEGDVYESPEIWFN